MVLGAYGSQSLIMCTEPKTATSQLTLFKFPLTLLQLNDLQSSLFQLIGISQAVIQNSCKFQALGSIQLLFSFTFPAVRYFKNRIDDSVPRMILF